MSIDSILYRWTTAEGVSFAARGKLRTLSKNRHDKVPFTTCAIDIVNDVATTGNDQAIQP